MEGGQLSGVVCSWMKQIRTGTRYSEGVNAEADKSWGNFMHLFEVRVV